MAGELTFRYVGTELDLFSEATRWKRYWSRRLRPFISGSVLEVGAGIGANVPYLWNQSVAAWVCLEPDGYLSGEIERRIDAGILPRGCTGCHGTIADMPASERFDTIAYLDVLEHVEEHRGELVTAAGHLAPGVQRV
jgi:2-polyprenyl-3-methyl-5-hydroxy-6-metoxy-1,4-benzoquinol methylase